MNAFTQMRQCKDVSSLCRIAPAKTRYICNIFEKKSEKGVLIKYLIQFFVETSLDGNLPTL